MLVAGQLLAKDRPLALSWYNRGMDKHPYLKLIAKNTFTLFNLVNVILAVMVGLVGSYKNMLFIVIAAANTLISIINGIRAQRTVDKLKLLAEQRPTVLRDGKPVQVLADAVRVGDLVVLSLGDQIMFDSVVQSGEIEVNEALISGEQDNLPKRAHDRLTSGSFVASGTAVAKVEHIGADNFVNRLQTEAHQIKTADSQLFTIMNKIVKYISYALIPVGALLLWARFRTEPDTTTAITSTVAALINMIPEGLILLTSSVLALATIRLSRRKVLVQDLYAIETLARVDTFCLDKTGTLTTGRMAVKDFLAFSGGNDFQAVNAKNPTSPAEKSFLTALTAILSHQTAENATVSALKKKLARGAKFKATSEIGEIIEVIPFSSERKYSGIKTEDAEYLMGAVEFVTDDKQIIGQAKALAGDYRTLAVVKITTDGAGRERAKVVPHAELLGVVRLEDEIRESAKGIVDYFYKNDIKPVVISGDDLETVVKIAEKTGIKDLRGVDLSAVRHKNYAKLVKDYAIFTRVKPSEKKELVKALRASGKTVAMTGDGVNDILAMKEADVSLAIGEGSDAARRAARFVLLDSGFEGIPAIVDEGRQSVNNLERSATLFLTKTVYASLLAVLFVVLPLEYPYIPVQMSLLNFLCIGFPGLILALEKNTSRVKNQFAKNIKTRSLPTGLLVAAVAVALSVTAHFTGMEHSELTTLAIIATFAIDFALIYIISRPLTKLRFALLAVILALMLSALFVPFARSFFEFNLPFWQN